MLARLLIGMLGCGWVLYPAAGQEKAPDIGEVRVYLCTLDYHVPWMSRKVQPRDYQDSFQQHWVEIYLPAHRVAWRLDTEGFLDTDAKRYQGGEPVVLGPPLPGKETIENLWRRQPPTRAQALPDLALTAKARQEAARKLADYLKKKT